MTAGSADTALDDFDITIAMTAQPLDGDFVARRLAHSEVIACASPEYLGQYGRPSHPADLSTNVTLLNTTAVVSRGPQFNKSESGETFSLALRAAPPLLTSLTDLQYAAALHGHGIAFLPSFMLEEALLEEALERVLPDWRLSTYII